MIKPSDLVLRISDKERLKSQGKRIDPGVSPLDKGDPDFATPDHICEAAREAMKQGYTHYIPGSGDKELIEAICDSLKEDYDCRFDPSGIIVTNGAAEAIYLACMSFLSPGDEMILFTPGYSLYAGCAMMAGAAPVWVELAEDFTLDRDAVERGITKKTKAICFNNPNNPTGTSFTREEVEFLAELAIEHDLLLISDEVYKKLYYDDGTHFCAGSIPEAKDRTILIDSFSKTYAMTGWRIGYIATTPELFDPMYAVHRTTLSCINWPTQRAALAALRGPQDCIWQMVREYDRRRKSIIKRLAGVEGFTCITPNSAFYFFGRFDADMKSADMVDYLYERKVAVRSGTEFGPRGEGWIRLSYAIPFEKVTEGIGRLAAAFKTLK
jgi:aspartate aminotransferase